MAFYKNYSVEIEDEDTGEPAEILLDFFYYPEYNGSFHFPAEPAYVDITKATMNGKDYMNWLADYQWKNIEGRLLESLSNNY